MRLWSLHPKYLDSKGLVALWREGLLAQKVLAGKTKGYRNHPQLARFRDRPRPLAAIGAYLEAVVAEADQRGYGFDRTKILERHGRGALIAVKRGQLRHEREHLLGKLERRDPLRFAASRERQKWSPHPLFKIVPGGIESWERV